MVAKGAIHTANATKSWLFGKITKIDKFLAKDGDDLK